MSPTRKEPGSEVGCQLPKRDIPAICTRLSSAWSSLSSTCSACPCKARVPSSARRHVASAPAAATGAARIPAAPWNTYKIVAPWGTAEPMILRATASRIGYQPAQTTPVAAPSRTNPRWYPMIRRYSTMSWYSWGNCRAISFIALTGPMLSSSLPAMGVSDRGSTMDGSLSRTMRRFMPSGPRADSWIPTLSAVRTAPRPPPNAACGTWFRCMLAVQDYK